MRRGIARESYNAGGAETSTSRGDDETEGAAGELLGALKALPEAAQSSGAFRLLLSSCLTAHSLSTTVLAALPPLTTLYFHSLLTHSSTLFPLPSKTTFPTASAARSASEIHSLQKRRALAAGWVRGISALLGWTADEVEQGAKKAQALGGVMHEVEEGDLHRDGVMEGWMGVLESLISGALARLSPATAWITRKALLELLSTILRLSYASTSNSLPAILASLAATPSKSSPAATALLSSLLTHHTRSLTLPSLLLELSTALAAPESVPNSLLTSFEFTEQLGNAMGGLVGAVSVRGCWDALVKEVEGAVPSLVAPAVSEEKDEQEGEPSKKRRKVSADAAEDNYTAAAARLRLLALFARSLPASPSASSSVLPLSSFTGFSSTFLSPSVKSLVKSCGKWKSAGKERRAFDAEVMMVGWELRERLAREGRLEEEGEWQLSGKRMGELRAVLNGWSEEKGEAELLVVIVRCLFFSVAVTIADLAQDRPRHSFSNSSSSPPPPLPKPPPPSPKFSSSSPCPSPRHAGPVTFAGSPQPPCPPLYGSSSHVDTSSSLRDGEERKS